ncbi:MAG: type I-U CRISPR-associated protein Cas5/Cas6 [Planctomycetales bacterium]|nr:type I-U CRISPR-associated protein Cas5/Cas6 [Planctomycetales bacterium]
MEILQIDFPAHRYHATPWDAHVNEGRIEWPPSQWRIIRALLAVGYTKIGWRESPPDPAGSALRKLCEVAPAYLLPTATESHTRHYMPVKDKTAKVFDAFLRFKNAAAQMQIRFDVELTADEREALAELVEGLTYLGRAESWVQATLKTSNAVGELGDCEQWLEPSSSGAGHSIRLLAAMADESFQTWRLEQVSQAADALESAERDKAEAKGKTLTPKAAAKARENADADYPEDILKALQQETSDWQSRGWPQPPGSRWVDYRIPQDLLGQEPLQTPPTASPQSHVHAVLLAIDGEGKQGAVRPLMKRALPLMETLHGEAVRRATSVLGLNNVPQLTGKDDAGAVLNGHRHLHWLPLSLYGAGRIDHVLVWCNDPLTPSTIAALSSMRWAYSKGIDRLSVNLAGLANVDDIAHQLGQQSLCVAAGLSPMQCGTVWKSVTPLVLRKFVHKRGKKSPEGQLREEIHERGFPDPISIQFWTSSEMVQHGLKGFVLTRRANKQQPPCQASWAATITFPTPVAGPLSLGYASHYGLGVFGSSPSPSPSPTREA